MIISAMLKNDADGVAVVEAHVDPELFRLRLGKVRFLALTFPRELSDGGRP